MSVLFVSSDLFSSSQFAGLIRQNGLDVRVALSCPAEFASAPETLVVFDLETPNTVAGIGQAKAAGKSAIAFGPHVKTALLESAQAAGCDVVLTRGQASRDLGAVAMELVKRTQ